jgi:hypothetical protein
VSVESGEVVWRQVDQVEPPGHPPRRQSGGEGAAGSEAAPGAPASSTWGSGGGAGRPVFGDAPCKKGYLSKHSPKKGGEAPHVLLVASF